MVNAILNAFPDARVGSSYIRIRCPYHKDGKEKKPSMSVLLEAKGDMPAGTCHCFACGKVVTIDELLGFNVITPENTRQITPNKVSLITTQSIYKPQLPFRFSPYLEGRGIGKEVQERFKIYEKDGLVNMPVFDRSGKYLFVNSRSIKTKQYYVQGGAQKTLWGIEEIDFAKPIVICEGQIDAMSFWELGMQAVATLGAGNIQALDAIAGATNIFILAFDNDSAGIKAREKALNILGKFRCRNIQYPEGVDMNDLLIKYRNKDKVLRFIKENTYI